MAKKGEIKLVIERPKERLRFIPGRGGYHADKRRQPRSTKKVALRRGDY